MNDLTIRLLATDADAEACARIMAASEPFLTLGRDFETSLRQMRDQTK